MAKEAPPIHLTPSDLVGSLTRGLQEVLLHLNNNATGDIHGPAVTAHLERMMQMASRIPAPPEKANDNKKAA